MIEQTIYQTLRDHAGLAALISGRAYPSILPQGATLPCVAFSRISTAHENDLDGHAGLDNLRVQVDCYASTFDGARALAAQVKLAMDALGTRDGDRDLYESATSVHRVSLDFSVWTND